MSETDIRIVPLRITDPETGRSAFVEVVDGKLVHGGDLPSDEAARVIMEAVGNAIHALMRQPICVTENQSVLGG